jgi:hypothetical protein
LTDQTGKAPAVEFEFSNPAGLIVWHVIESGLARGQPRPRGSPACSWPASTNHFRQWHAAKPLHQPEHLPTFVNVFLLVFRFMTVK